MRILNRLSIILSFAALLLGGDTLFAQERPNIELGGGFATTAATGYGNDYPIGWLVIATKNIVGPLAITGETGHSRKTSQAFGFGELRSNLFTVAAGAQLSYRPTPRTNVFGHVLLGAARLSNSAIATASTAFQIQPGGGVDVKAFRQVWLRFQGDYRLLRLDESFLKQFRLGIGAVLAL